MKDFSMVTTLCEKLQDVTEGLNRSLEYDRNALKDTVYKLEHLTREEESGQWSTVSPETGEILELSRWEKNDLETNVKYHERNIKAYEIILETLNGISLDKVVK